MLDMFNQANDISKRLQTLERSSTESLAVLEIISKNVQGLLGFAEWLKKEIKNERTK